jgi:hypothetical protein
MAPQETSKSPQEALNTEIARLIRGFDERQIVEVMLGTEPTLLARGTQQQQQQQQQKAQ